SPEPREGKPPRAARARGVSACLRGDERLLVAVGLAALGFLDERGGRREALAVPGSELARAGHEAGDAVFVAVDVLQDAAGPGRPSASIWSGTVTPGCSRAGPPSASIASRAALRMFASSSMLSSSESWSTGAG